MTEEEITAETGTAKPMLEKLLSLRKLNPALMEAFKEGRIKSSVAFRAAKQRPKVQKAIAKYLKDNGRVRADDVSRVRRAVREEAVARLPFEVFDPTGQADWKTKVIERVTTLRSEIRDDAPQAIIDMLDVVVKETQRTVVGKPVEPVGTK